MNDGSDWSVNSQFVAEVRQLSAGTERPVVLICRSGNRSQEAGEALERAGFTEVFNVESGFEGLPWEQC